MVNLRKSGRTKECEVSSSTVSDKAMLPRLKKTKKTAKSERLSNDEFTKFRAINKLKRYEERILS